METCTTTSTRGTTLLSRVAVSPQRGGLVRPRVTSTLRIAPLALAKAARWRAGAPDRGLASQPFSAFHQGGAVTDAAPVADPSVIDLMVTDHPYSTRLGPFSCRPPV